MSALHASRRGTGERYTDTKSRRLMPGSVVPRYTVEATHSFKFISPAASVVPRCSRHVELLHADRLISARIATGASQEQNQSAHVLRRDLCQTQLCQLRPRLALPRAHFIFISRRPSTCTDSRCRRSPCTPLCPMPSRRRCRRRYLL